MGEHAGSSVPSSADDATNASALIYNDTGEYLLHLRDQRPGIWEPGAWSLLGGGREPGDRSIEETVRRELREEAGLEIPALELLTVHEVTSDDGKAVVQAVFTGCWNGDPAGLHLTEGVMLHWFRPETMPRLRMSPSTMDLVVRHANGRPAGERGARPSRPGFEKAALNVVGVHLYLENSDGEVLLGLRHPDSAYAGNMHHFLAGHCERESAVACLVREAEEEAGLLIDPADAEFVHAVHLVEGDSRPRVQLVFRVRRWDGEPEVREPDKCLGWGWWRPDGLPARTVPYTRAAIEGIRAGRPYTEMGWT